MRHVPLLQHGRLPLLIGVLIATLGGAAPAGATAFGALDAGFATATGSGPNDRVYDMAEQPDGKVVVVGEFTSWNGANAPGIVRLNGDGSVDTSFAVATGAESGKGTWRVGVQPDGGVIVTGDFDSFNGTTGLGGIVRLTSTGAVDTAFAANTGTGFRYTQFSATAPATTKIAVQPDGKIVVIGQIDQLDNVYAPVLLRLNADGTRDQSFNAGGDLPGFNTYPSWIRTVTGDRLLTGGYFTSWGGLANSSSFALLSGAGAPDEPFRTAAGFANNQSYTGVVQADGKVILAGNFTNWNGASYLTRLNADGSPDTAWIASTADPAMGRAFSSDLLPGDVTVLAGAFTSLARTTAPGVTALKADGTVDAGFVSAVGTGPGPLNARTETVVEYLGGHLYAYGTFTEWNGQAASRIVRLVAASPAAPAATSGTAATPTTGAASRPAVRFRSAPATTATGVVSRLTVPGPGTLTQIGTTPAARSGRAGMAACSGRLAVKRAGTYTVVCRLTAAARAMRVKQDIRLVLRTTFRPRSGQTVTVRRVVVVKRLAGASGPEAVTG